MGYGISILPAMAAPILTVARVLADNTIVRMACPLLVYAAIEISVPQLPIRTARGWT